jgi:hypothetical protein
VISNTPHTIEYVETEKDRRGGGTEIGFVLESWWLTGVIIAILDVMGTIHKPRWGRVGMLFVLVGCSTTAHMESNDEGRGPSNALDRSDEVSSCIKNNCEWQASECTADPGCASWLTCFAESNMGEDDGRCDAIDVGPTGQPAKEAVLSCKDTRCIVGPEHGGAPTAPGDASAGLDYDGAFTTASATECEECLKSTSCVDRPHCEWFKGRYNDCLTSENTSKTLEECLLGSLNSKSNINDAYTALQGFLETAYDVMLNDCESECLIIDSCATCQLESCWDEHLEVYSEYSTVLGWWCRPPLVANSLNAICGSFYNDNREVLGQYNGCLKTNCADECASYLK